MRSRLVGPKARVSKLLEDAVAAVGRLPPLLQYETAALVTDMAGGG